MLGLLQAIDDARESDVVALELWREKLHTQANVDVMPLKELLGMAKHDD